MTCTGFQPVTDPSISSFRTLRKIHHKTRMRARIGLNFGTLKGLIKADLCTNFGRNPMNIHGVMTNYLRKIRSKVCHAYRVNLVSCPDRFFSYCVGAEKKKRSGHETRVNSFEESVENSYVDGATIVGVPFCGVKGIGIKTMEI